MEKPFVDSVITISPYRRHKPEHEDIAMPTVENYERFCASGGPEDYCRYAVLVQGCQVWDDHSKEMLNSVFKFGRYAEELGEILSREKLLKKLGQGFGIGINFKSPFERMVHKDSDLESPKLYLCNGFNAEEKDSFRRGLAKGPGILGSLGC